jgi:periplasmic divalent cation tolerance protein
MVLVTTKDHKEAEKISQTLLSEGLIACANIINPVASSFIWQGRIDNAKESLVVMKTKRDLFAQLVQKVIELHSYKVPEILALPIIDGSKEYLDWIRINVKT